MGIQYMVTCENKEKVAAAKKLVEAQGGKIGDTMTVTSQGFFAELPEDSVSTLSSNTDVIKAMDKVDGEVKTQ